MSPRALRFIVIVLGALTLGLSFAHLMEMPARRSWDQSLWVATTVHGNLYRMFGPKGPGPWIEVSAILSTVTLAYLVRGDRRAFIWTAAGAACLVLAHASWWALVFPANLELASWVAGPVPADWQRWRDRWEFGHATGCIMRLLGFAALVGSVVRETRASYPAGARPQPAPA